MKYWLHRSLDKKEQLDAALAEAVKDVKSNDAKERGLALGRIAGKAIVALRLPTIFSRIPLLKSTIRWSRDAISLFLPRRLFMLLSGQR